MNTNEQTQLLDCLQSLLERQIELAQQANIGDVELLSEQTTCLVEKIAQTGVLESAEFENRREQLQRLYSDLNLALFARKDDVVEKLKQIQKGIKIVQAYRRNI